MWLDAFQIDGEAGICQVEDPKKFCFSADSYLPLLSDEYINIVGANRPFGKEVTESEFAYYGIMHLWARIVAVKRHQSQLTHDEQSFLNEFEHNRWPTTQPMNSYLRCVGDFTDTTGFH